MNVELVFGRLNWEITTAATLTKWRKIKHKMAASGFTRVTVALNITSGNQICYNEDLVGF